MLDGQVTSLSTTPDETRLHHCGNQLLHLRDRVRRLRTHRGYRDQLLRLEQDIDGLTFKYTHLARRSESDEGAMSPETQRHSLVNLLKIDSTIHQNSPNAAKVPATPVRTADSIQFSTQHSRQQLLQPDSLVDLSTMHSN